MPNLRIGPPHTPFHKKIMAGRQWKQLTEEQRNFLAALDKDTRVALYDLWREPDHPGDNDDGRTAASIDSIVDHPFTILEATIGAARRDVVCRFIWRTTDSIVQIIRDDRNFVRIEGFDEFGEIVRPLTVSWLVDNEMTQSVLEQPVDPAALATQVCTFLPNAQEATDVG